MITIGINKPQSSGTVVLPLIEKTHFELLSMKKVGDLIAGQKYLLTDFQTIYDQPDYDIAGNPKIYVDTKLGYVEPLILEAVSTSEFSPIVSSTVFKSDIIHYDIDFDKTEAMNVPAKGRITKRIDERNNECYFDSRAILYKRYEKVEGSGIFEDFKDTGFASAELPTFDETSFNNLISKTEAFQIYGEAFMLPNTVMKACNRVKLYGDYILSNTVNNSTNLIINSDFYFSYLKEVINLILNEIGESILKGALNSRVTQITNSNVIYLEDSFVHKISGCDNLFAISLNADFDNYGISSTDFAGALLIKENFPKTFYRNTDGVQRLRYFDGSNNLIDASITD